MTSNKDNKELTLDLSEDLRNYYSFPNNSFENNSFEKEINADNIRPNSHPSIYPDVNNPQNENYMLDDNRFYNSRNFDLSIGLNINNSQIGNDIFDDDILSDSLNFPRSNDLNVYNFQNENDRLNSSSIFHSHIGIIPNISLNENESIIHAIPSGDLNFHSPSYSHVNIPLNENVSIFHAISSDDINFHSLSYPHVNNTLNENVSIENAKINDSLNFHQFIDSLNVNNCKFENDSIENGRLNNGFNSMPLIDNINVNNPQFENDKINRAKVSKERKQIFTISKQKKIKKNIKKKTEYNKKFFKSHFCKFLKKQANKIIQRSKLPKKLKKLKIYSPNSLSFTANTTKSYEYKFLSFTIKKIFTFYIKKKCKNTFRYQEKCKENIEIILKFIDESEDESKYKEVKSFFNMTLEEAYELFYQDEEFKKFQEDPRVIEIDEKIKSINGVYLREKNGFIQLIKSHPKEN